MTGQTRIDPSRTALVLMDFQPAVLASLGAHAGKPLAHAEQALRWARENDVRVAHVRVAFSNKDRDSIPSHNKTFGTLKGRNVLVDGTAECDIVERLRPNADEIVVRKTRVGAFSTTNLNDQLQLAGIRTLILAGVRTSGVVLSTVREAADQDYGLYVLSDACADADAHVHDVLTDKVFPHQADVIATAELNSLS